MERCERCKMLKVTEEKAFNFFSSDRPQRCPKLEIEMKR